MKQVGNTILAKGVNHILAKRDNSAWPKGAKLSGFSSVRIVEENDENERNRPLWKQLMVALKRGDELVIPKFFQCPAWQS